MSDLNDVLVERVAEGFYDWQTGTTGQFATSMYRDNWLRGAKRVLDVADAARPTSPHSIDEVKLAEVIRRADTEWQIRENRLETASPLTHGSYVARAVSEWLRGGGQ